MVTMKIKLYKDSAGGLLAEFLDGLNSVSQNNSNVNGVLVVLDNFELAPTEVLRIGYELESGAEVDDYTLMEDNGDGMYSAEMPPAVTRSDVSTKWLLGLQIASEWVTNDDYTGYLYKQNLVSPLPFTVNNAVRDLNGKYPTRGDLTALYKEAQAKIEKEEKNAEKIEALQAAPLIYNRPIDFGGKTLEQTTIFSSLSVSNFNRTPKVGDVFYAICMNIGENGVAYAFHCQVDSLSEDGATVSVTPYWDGNLAFVSEDLVSKVLDTAFTVSMQSKAIEEVKSVASSASIEASNANVDIFLMSMQLKEATAQHTSDIEGLRHDIINESHFRGYLLTNAEVQALTGNANDYAYSAESGTKWIFRPAPMRWVDSGVPVPDQSIPASDSSPLMDGEASAGQEGAYARGDHRHPSDTSKVSKTGDTMSGDLNIVNKDKGSVSRISHDRVGVYRCFFDVYGHFMDMYACTELRDGYLQQVVDNQLAQTRRINFPSVRYGEYDYGRPLVLDETLAALSDLEPIADKLDTVEEIAKGAQQAESFVSYAEMVEALRSEFLGGSDLTELKYKKGQSVYIETVDVPDLWVSRIEEDNFNPYTYTNDEAIVSAIATNGYIQVGHYRLARLENGKVIMSDYLRKIDVKNSNGIEVSPEGAVRLSPAFPAELRDRAYYKPVTGGNLDAALLYGLSENKLIPTEPQKNAMRAWLGVQPVNYNTPSGITGNGRILGMSGADIYEYFTCYGHLPYSVVITDNYGYLHINDPTQDDHPAPKAYADKITKYAEGVAATLDSKTKYTHYILGTGTYGNCKQLQVKPNSMVIFSSNGNVAGHVVGTIWNGSAFTANTDLLAGNTKGYILLIVTEADATGVCRIAYAVEGGSIISALPDFNIFPALVNSDGVALTLTVEDGSTREVVAMGESLVVTK